MVRSKAYISLLFLAACIGSIGCNPGIIDVPSPTVTDVSKYFWNGNSPQATFRDVDSLGAVKSTFTLRFLDSLNTFQVTESGTGAGDVLLCNVTGDSVRVTGLSPHSIIPIPDGYSVKPFSSRTTSDSSIALQHIISINNHAAVGSNNELGIYYSSTYGTSWVSAQGSFGKLGDPVVGFALMPNNVYAATARGNVIVSSDGGKDWSSVTSRFIGTKIISMATAPSQNLLYISLDNDSCFELALSPLKITSLATKHTQLQFTSLAYLNQDSLLKFSILAGGTANGLYYRILMRNGVDTTDWTLATSLKISKVRSLIVTNDINGFYCSAGNTIYTSSDGINWNPVAGIDSGKLVYDASTGKVISWTAQGKVQTVPANGPVIPTLSKVINDFAVSGGNYFAATNAGASILVGSSQLWQDSIAGLSITRTIGADIPGNVLLLRAISGSSVSDSTWLAGTLINNQSKAEYPFTARLVDHLDSVTMPDSTSYTDVLEAQYYLGTGNQSGSFPYWQIYYARNTGPIIIREIGASGVLRRIYRWKN